LEPPGDGVLVQGRSDAVLVIGAGDDDCDEAVGQFGVYAGDSDARESFGDRVFGGVPAEFGLVGLADGGLWQPPRMIRSLRRPAR
jgi:hypothetical protein